MSMGISVIFVAALAHAGWSGTTGHLRWINPLVSLSGGCDVSNLLLDCPPAESDRLSGTIYTRPISYPNLWLVNNTCSFNVTLKTNCRRDSNYAIYINIRKFYLPGTDRMRMYEYQTGTRVLVKDLSGSYIPTTWTLPSVGQLLTQYSQQPLVTVELTRGTAYPDNIHQVIMDAVIVEAPTRLHSDHTYCKALSGYMGDALLCDANLQDRIACPSSYWTSVGSNPATGRQSCSNSEAWYIDGNNPALTPTGGSSSNWEQLGIDPSVDFFSRGCTPTNIILGCHSILSTVSGVIVSKNISYTATWPISDTCSFNVTLSANCEKDSSYAIYVNIRKFNLPGTDGVKMYEHQQGRRVLVKALSGRYTPAAQTLPSVAQLRTQYSQRPGLTVELTRGSAFSAANHQVIMDFVLVQATTQFPSHYTYCNALSGYMGDGLLCDHSNLKDHIACPSSYSASEGSNPATGRQSCSSTPASYTIGSGKGGSLSSGAIRGIVISCVFVLALMCAIMKTCCKK